jgi:class 3 adenylate cyclase
MDEQLGDLFIRIGMLAGRAQLVMLGHPQNQTLTVLGPTVNIAVKLCETARRDRDVIVIDESITDVLPATLHAVPTSEGLPHREQGVEAAYELLRAADAKRNSVGS